MSSTAPTELPPVAEVPAAHLAGRQLANGWRVGERIFREAGASGGHFSIGYCAHQADGSAAFLKALNIAAVLGSGSGSIIDRMKHFSNAYVSERDLLQQCCDKRMTRVIRLIDHGQVDIPEAGVLREVPYLILEMADGDIRAYQSGLSDFDLAWVLRALKHTAQGVEQLHSVQAAHQDLKPSNVLTQRNGALMKLGDVGRAELRDGNGPHADRQVPGAVGYAPPEQLYGAFARTWEERRAGDLYQLGSMTVQLFLGHSMTAMVQQTLPPSFRFMKWQGDFSAVLPYLHNAHSDVIREFEEVVLARTRREDMTADLVRAAREMTNADPAGRGHPRDRVARSSSYGVRRYVSLFNRLAAQARLGIRADP